MNLKIATFTFYGFILKVDQAGNNVFIKTLSNNPGLGQTAALKYLEIHNIVEVSTNNIVLNGLINYYFSSVGYSENSYIDQIVFSLSANGSTQWASVLDYNLAYDSDGKMAYYDSVVYSALFAGTLLLISIWFQELGCVICECNLFPSFGNSNSSYANYNLTFII